jgi:hypothetical protein
MLDSSLDVKYVDDLEYLSKCGNTKREWHTPELMEMDYNETTSGGGFVNDGGGFS